MRGLLNSILIFLTKKRDKIMATITLSIETGNSAFEDNPDEIKEVFEKAAQKIQDGLNSGESTFDLYLRDSNGNKVGTVNVEGEMQHSLNN